MKKYADFLLWLLKMAVGCFLFGLGFDLFLEPYGMNSGGISGLAQVLVELLGFGSVGTLSILINLPLFLLGGLKIGKKFFFGSLIGINPMADFNRNGLSQVLGKFKGKSNAFDAEISDF